VKRWTIALVLSFGFALGITTPAQAAYSGSFTKAEYDFVYNGCGDERGCLTRNNVEDGVCDCEGVVQSDDVWPDGSPRRIVAYLLGDHVSIDYGYGVFIYYRQKDNGNWVVRLKELCTGDCDIEPALVGPLPGGGEVNSRSPGR
jgi:hypothetical protein